MEDNHIERIKALLTERIGIANELDGMRRQLSDAPPTCQCEVCSRAHTIRARIAEINTMIAAYAPGEVSDATDQLSRDQDAENVAQLQTQPEEEVFGARAAPDETPDGVFGARARRLNIGDIVIPSCHSSGSGNCEHYGDVCRGRGRGVQVTGIDDEWVRLNDGGGCSATRLTLVRSAQQCPNCGSILTSRTPPGDGIVLMCIPCRWREDGQDWNDDDSDDYDSYEEDEEENEEEDDYNEEEEEDGDSSGWDTPSESSTENAMKKIKVTEKNVDEICDRLSANGKGIPGVENLMSWVGRDGLKDDIGSMTDAVKACTAKGAKITDILPYLMNLCDCIPRVYRHTDSIFHGDLSRFKKQIARAKNADSSSDITKMQVLGLLKNFNNIEYSEEGHVFTVDTDDCIAKGVNFGPFRVGLWTDTGHLKLKALRPFYPDPTYRQIVHPHIDRDGGGLCLGAGQNAFYKAVEERRICDALLIVKAVLNQYGSNPYHRIDAWKRMTNPCIVCGSETVVSTCRGCRSVMCQDHAFRCATCGSTICHDHVRKCRDCGKPMCGPCKREFRVCGHCDSKTPDWEDKVDKFKDLASKLADAKPELRKSNVSDTERLGGGFKD